MIANNYELFIEPMKKFWKQTVIMTEQPGKYTKSQRTVLIKMMNFMIQGLHFNMKKIQPKCSNILE